MNKLQLLAATLAAGAALALDIPAVPTWPSGRCTDKSLTIPSWIISKYQVSGGTVSFRVDNRAADPRGLITDISCTPQGDCQPTGNSEITAAISKDADGHTVVTLRETWVCGDGGEQVVFDASGSTTITHCSGSDCVSPIPYLVYGSLTLPVPLKPTQPSPPPGYDAPTCANVGADQWAISGLTFQNYTTSQCKEWYLPEVACLDASGTIGAPSTFLSKGIYLNLTVTNKAINYPVTCGFVPSYNNYVLPSPLRCTGGDFNEITLDLTWSGSAPNFNLKIEQLWYCLEHPDTNVNATAILASGSVDLALTCQSRPGITGNADDIITTCADPAGSRLVAAANNTAETLPAFSLVTAYPAQGGCTFDSVVDPTFYMRDVYFQTGPFTDATKSQTTLTRFSCTLTGPGFADYSFYGGTPISGSGVDAIYDCNSYYNGQPKQDHWNCTFSFDPFSAVITLDKVWQCNDKNPTDIIYFDGSGTFDWKIDPHYYCEGNDTLSCLWTDDLALLQPGIPYKIPKVTASLVNVLPPDHEDTVRVSGKWSKVNGN